MDSSAWRCEIWTKYSITVISLHDSSTTVRIKMFCVFVCVFANVFIKYVCLERIEYSRGPAMRCNHVLARMTCPLSSPLSVMPVHTDTNKIQVKGDLQIRKLCLSYLFFHLFVYLLCDLKTPGKSLFSGFVLKLTS